MDNLDFNHLEHQIKINICNHLLEDHKDIQITVFNLTKININHQGNQVQILIIEDYQDHQIQVFREVFKDNNQFKASTNQDNYI